MNQSVLSKCKKIGAVLFVTLILMSCASLMVFGAYEEKVSSLNFYDSFYGSERDYLYRDVGYKYSNCTCSVPGAYMKTTLKMKTGFLGTWESKGTIKNTGVNGTKGVYYGWTHENANTTGKTKAGQYHFEPCDNAWNGTPYSRESIVTDNFIMYSQQ